MKGAEWASKSTRDIDFDSKARTVIPRLVRIDHWSRLWEYPWALEHGNLFKDGREVVLDAAGGDGILQVLLADHCSMVVNLDSDRAALLRAMERYSDIPCFKRVRLTLGDLGDIRFPDGFFDNVFSLSVLEHTGKDHGIILEELVRVLRPGGRLVVTMDVAPNARHNHAISDAELSYILRRFGIVCPPQPADILTHVFAEDNPRQDEPKVVQLRVLGFWWDKE